MSEEKMYRVIIFDADGTLRLCTVEGQPCPNRDNEWKLIEGVREKLASLDPLTILGIASNQAGVSLGHFQIEMARSLLVQCYIAAVGHPPAHPNLIQLCPHAPVLKCSCRKPEPKMLWQVVEAATEMSETDIQPQDVLYVGDMETDEQAARNAGYAFQYADAFFGRSQKGT